MEGSRSSLGQRLRGIRDTLTGFVSVIAVSALWFVVVIFVAATLKAAAAWRWLSSAIRGMFTRKKADGAGSRPRLFR